MAATRAKNAARQHNEPETEAQSQRMSTCFFNARFKTKLTDIKFRSAPTFQHYSSSAPDGPEADPDNSPRTCGTLSSISGKLQISMLCFKSNRKFAISTQQERGYYQRDGSVCMIFRMDCGNGHHVFICCSPCRPSDSAFNAPLLCTALFAVHRKGELLVSFHFLESHVRQPSLMQNFGNRMPSLCSRVSSDETLLEHRGHIVHTPTFSLVQCGSARGGRADPRFKDRQCRAPKSCCCLYAPAKIPERPQPCGSDHFAPVPPEFGGFTVSESWSIYLEKVGPEWIVMHT